MRCRFLHQVHRADTARTDRSSASPNSGRQALARRLLVLVAILTSCTKADVQSMRGGVGSECQVNGNCNQGLVCTNNRCGAADIGHLGGPCYPNHTCEGGADCVDSQCVATEPCYGVSCSGHGTCVVDGSQAKCQCASGYEVNGLSCVQGNCTPTSQVSYACDQEVAASRLSGGKSSAAAEPIRSRMSARTIFPSTQDRTLSSMKFGSSSSPQMDFHRLKSNSICQS
jgi:hypothetical protein